MDKRDFILNCSLDGEIWADVKDCGGIYIVSSLGRIVSFARKKPRVIKPVLYIERNKPYYSVCLKVQNKSQKKRVHRIVAEALINNPTNLPEIDHINNDSLDNRVENLKWCTHAENMRNPHTKAKLKLSHKIKQPWYNRDPGTNPKSKKAVVQIIDEDKVIIYDGAIDTAKNGFRPTNVTNVCKGKVHTHRGYRWMYLSDYEKIRKRS